MQMQLGSTTFDRSETSMRRSIPFFLLLFFSTPLYAGNCDAPIATCATAELIKRDLMKGLPQQVSQNMTITHVMRINTEIHLYTQLSYNMAFLEANMMSKGATPDDARRAIQIQAQNYYCSTDQLKQALIKGVSFHNHYKLANGQAFVTTEVIACTE